MIVADGVRAAPAPAGALTCTLHDRVADIDLDAWNRIVSPQDWSMRPEVLGVEERTLSDQARFWFAIVRDAEARPMACAAFAMFATDTIQAAPAPIKSIAAALRRLWPSALRMKLLFCGLPIPDGGNHLRLAADADMEAVLSCLVATMTDTARRHGARLLVIKEFDAEMARKLQPPLARLGFIRGTIPPMHRLRRPFPDFDAYRKALRSSYRRQVDASLKMFANLGATVTHLTEPAEIERRFTDEVHRLYLNVLHRNAQRLEAWPAAFFRELGHALPGRVVLTLAEAKGHPVGFAFGVDTPEGYSNLYVGVNYALIAQFEVYYNMFYLSMAAAFERGAAEIKLGSTSNSFKSRLGSEVSETFVFARAVSPAANRAFRALSGVLFPALGPVPSRKVFKDDAQT